MTAIRVLPFEETMLRRRTQTFVVPDLAGPVTGGTLFNRLLIGALKRLGWTCSAVSKAESASALASASSDDDVWIDTLYLDDFAEIAARLGHGARIGLLTHYLPSLVRYGGEVGPEQLSVAEAQALRSAGMFLVPSLFMRSTIERLCDVHRRPIVCVEPGHLAEKGEVLAGPPVRAALVANLVPGKGVAPFLERLVERIHEEDDFHLSIVGSAAFDPEYARRCGERGDDERLRGRVRFVGALSPLETVRFMADCNAIVSASTMEAYGMVIADARTLGLPILAHGGGNVAELVNPSSGGEVVWDADALAQAFLAFCRNKCEQARRLDLARAHALPPRSWSDAAHDFEMQLLTSLSRPLPLAAREGVHED